jgi:hypothetical protein
MIEEDWTLTIRSTGKVIMGTVNVAVHTLIHTYEITDSDRIPTWSYLKTNTRMEPFILELG